MKLAGAFRPYGGCFGRTLDAGSNIIDANWHSFSDSLEYAPVQLGGGNCRANLNLGGVPICCGIIASPIERWQ